MLMINGKAWYSSFCSDWDVQGYTGVTDNEVILGGINWMWYHYPTKEEALEGLKIRSPYNYERELEKHWSTGCMKSFATREEALEFLHMARKSEDYAEVRVRYWGMGHIKKNWPTGCNSFGDKIEPEYTAYFNYRSEGWCLCHMEEERYGIEHWAYRLHK